MFILKYAGHVNPWCSDFEMQITPNQLGNAIRKRCPEILVGTERYTGPIIHSRGLRNEIQLSARTWLANALTSDFGSSRQHGMVGTVNRQTSKAKQVPNWKPPGLRTIPRNNTLNYPQRRTCMRARVETSLNACRVCLLPPTIPNT